MHKGSRSCELEGCEAESHRIAGRGRWRKSLSYQKARSWRLLAQGGHDYVKLEVGNSEEESHCLSATLHGEQGSETEEAPKQI